MKAELIVENGRVYKHQPVVRFECVVAYRRVETWRSRLARFVKAHIIDADPWDDESHAATRYREGAKATSLTEAEVEALR